MQAIKIALCAFAIVICGCSAHPEPIIDSAGVNMAAYEADLEQCTAYSEQIRIEEGAARGAVGGAVVGAATGAISGDVARGAGYGSIWGATRYGTEADRDRQNVVKRCLRYRGYQVLN